MPTFITSQNAVVLACIFAFVVVATQSFMLIAILKRRKVKASGWFYKSGFEIEASDNPSNKKHED